MPTEREARRLIDTVLKLSNAEQTEVSVHTVDSSPTRFANNEIHQNVAERDTSVSVRIGLQRRYGLASTNDVTDAGLEKMVDQATAIARTLPELDDFLALPEPQELAALNAYNVGTAEFGPQQRASGVRTICQQAQEQGLSAAGAFRVDIGGHTIGSSLGLFAHHESTTAELMTVVMSDDSSGHAGWLAIDVAEIDPEQVATEAVGKARRGRDPRTLEPGEYDVVLEPYAVSDMLDFLAYTGMGAMALQEGRSFMTGKLGQRLMGANVSISDDGLDPSGVVRPFDYEGVPARRVDMIVDGVARSPVHDRRTAAKDGATSTGHALPPAYTIGPMPMNMFLKPGEATAGELIASVERGLLVTRFWYTRVVHPLTVTMTGMTRDGTFLIENGEIAGPVKNLRFTQSYVEAMGNVGLIGKETKLVREFFAANRVPSLKIGAWSFTGATEY